MDFTYKLSQKVHEFIKEKDMIHQGDSIVVGISGGADSVCLFLMLINLAKKIDFNIYAVHVNHGIRGESARRDELFSKTLCERYSVDCAIYNEDVIKYAKDKKLTVEEAGRILRYQIFEKEAAKHNNAKIAVAHHMNDQAETVLFNIIRGSGLKGVSGISPVRDKIIRPILCITKDEILHYLEEINQSYCLDETNLDTNYSRNAIRNIIIKELEKIQSESVAHIANSADEIREADEYIREVARAIFTKDIAIENNVYLIPISILKTEKPIIMRYVIRMVIECLLTRLKDVTRTHVDDIYALTFKGSGKEIILPKGLVAKRVKKGIEMFILTEI